MLCSIYNICLCSHLPIAACISAYDVYKNIDKDPTTLLQQAWEPKPTRMLLLHLTDGATDVKGMEYSPLPAFTAHTRPGAKVRSRGGQMRRKMRSAAVRILKKPGRGAAQVGISAGTGARAQVPKFSGAATFSTLTSSWVPRAYSLTFNAIARA